MAIGRLRMAIGRFRLMVLFFSITIDKLNTDLLGQGQFDLLARWSSQLGHTLLNRLRGVLNLWDSDALVLNLVFAVDTGKVDWLVDTGLDWLRVGDSHRNINSSDNRNIVFSGLGHLIAIFVGVSSMTIASI